MAEYTTATTVDLGADLVFARVSDPNALPAYVPNVDHARLVGREEILVSVPGGETAAWLRVYTDSRQLAWGTADGGYRGELHVIPRAGETGDLARCSLTVTVRSDRAGAAELAAGTERALAALVRAAGGVASGDTPAGRGL